jgi:glycosyltransferase involved in cell wall biosynthesis
MNILFLTLLDFSTIYENGIYTDLIREFSKDNHTLCIISPIERRKNEPTRLISERNCKILKLQIGNIQKTNIIEKGISTLTLEFKFKQGIMKYFSDYKFDLVIYSTPPITFKKAVEFVKKRDGAKTYLILKDIFPQNAVDLGLLRKTGVKGLLYKFFKYKEKMLYKQSDYIGCMSEANKDYLLKHNLEIQQDIVEICPNSIEPQSVIKDKDVILNIKKKYGIPLNKIIFIYGGNLGKPQGIDFLIECLSAVEDIGQVFFVIVGSGTEYNKIKKYFENKPINAKLLYQLSKKDYEILANSCDVGLIFLDKRFTIPNFPSRLLSYMESSMPVLAATDVNTDIGKVIEEGNFGYWCKSGDVEEFKKRVQDLCNSEVRNQMGLNARLYLERNYTSSHSYKIIMKHFE